MVETTIIPLGTASAIPTRERHPSATALVRKGRVLLFDCGEGTQMRFIQAGLKITRIDAVFITHFHGDHYFGLFGLISTLLMIGREDPICIVGPTGIAEAVGAMPGINLDRSAMHVAFIELHEALDHRVVYETDEVFVEARPIDHRAFAVGFRFQEKEKPGRLDVERARQLGVTDYRQYRDLKAGRSVEVDGRTVTPEMVVGPERPGRSFAYVTDTRPSENGRILSRKADLVYHEATFTDKHAEKAFRTGHSTAREAAEVARRAQARKLLIGHFSARHTDPSDLLAEAREVFKNTDVAEELKRYSL